MAAGGLRLYLLLSFLVVSVNSVQECKKIDDCSCKKSNGKTMSLKPIDGKPGPKFTGIKQVDKNEFTFSWNPCTKFTSGDGCSNVLLCQTGSAGDTYPVGETVESFTETDSGSIIMTYTSVTYQNYLRTGVIILQCDEKEYPGTPSAFKEDSSGGQSQYAATFASKCVCDGGCSNEPGGNGSGETGGLSTGSILLIVFFPLVFVYFVAGILYNKYHKGVTSYSEMIPNHSFWSDFPLMVKDGCVFTFQSISGCCSSLCMKLKGDSYAKM